MWRCDLYMSGYGVVCDVKVAWAELSAFVGHFEVCPALPGKIQSSSLANLTVALRASRLMARTESFEGVKSPWVEAIPYRNKESDGLQAFSGTALALSGALGPPGPLAQVPQRQSVHFLAAFGAPERRGTAVLHTAGVDVFFVDQVAQCPYAVADGPHVAHDGAPTGRQRAWGRGSGRSGSCGGACASGASSCPRCTGPTPARGPMGL